MKALILAGGLGTRLRPLTTSRPKPMVPVVNRPILEHTVDLLKKNNIREIVLLLYHFPEFFQSHFDDGSRYGVGIEYVIADRDFATAGAVKLASQFVSNTFLVVSGDVITDLNIAAFIQFHKQKKGLASIALANVQNPSPFGIAQTDDTQRITRFLEKPTANEIFSQNVNMGIYVMEPEILDLIPESQEYYFAKHLFPFLVETKQPIFGFVHGRYWIDVGNVILYKKVHADFLSEGIALRVKEQRQDEIWQGKDCQISKKAAINLSVLGNACQISDGAILQNCILGDGCRIGENSFLKDTILWESVQVGSNCRLVSNVVDSRATITDNKSTKENQFIAEKSI